MAFEPEDVFGIYSEFYLSPFFAKLLKLFQLVHEKHDKNCFRAGVLG